MWFVYILECEDGSLYTGITTDIGQRFISHKNGSGSRYTRSHAPVRVVYSEACAGKSNALKREAAIKKLSRQDKLKLLAA